MEIDFIFEQKQMIKVNVFDIDSASSRDDLGSVEFELGKLMGSRQNLLTQDIIFKGKKAGVMILRVEKVNERQNEYEFQLSGKHLKRFAMFGTIDPFVRFYKPRVD